MKEITRKIFLFSIIFTFALFISYDIFQYIYALRVTIDASVSTTVAEHNGPSPTIVFTTDQVGYAFYVDSNGTAVYSKTTNGGASWGGAVTVDSQTDVAGVAVWYDRWTPADTTGNFIHVITWDPSADDVWYTRIDTANSDAKSTLISISSAPGPALSNSLDAGLNAGAITKADNDVLYVGITDQTGGWVLRCSSTCTTASNWTQTSTPTFSNADGDWLLFLPYTNNDIMAIWWDATSGQGMRSKIYEDAGNTWPGSWTIIDNTASAVPSSNYDAAFSATINPTNYNIYLVYVADEVYISDSDGDIKTWVYDGSWTQKAYALQNDSRGITGIALSYDSLNDVLHLIYAVTTDILNFRSNAVYSKYSTDGMTTWSDERGSFTQYANRSIYGLRSNIINSNRIYATWDGAVLDDLFGNTIIDIAQYTQSAFRFFENTDTTDVGSPIGLQDTASTLSSPDQEFRLRLLMHIGGSQLGQNGQYFKLQYVDKGSGTCSSPSGGTPSSYTDVTDSTFISFNDNSPSNGTSLTSNANDPAHGGDTSANQTYVETKYFTNGISGIGVSEDGKWDFALIDNDATSGTTFCFRAVRADGYPLDNYSVYPEITTSSGASQSLTFSISDNVIGFGTLNSSSAQYATGDGLGSSSDSSPAHTISASTNASGGYVITLDGSTLTCSSCGGATINPIGGTALPSSPGSKQFGLRGVVVSGTGSVSTPYSTANWAFDSSAFPDTIFTGSGDNSETVFGLRYIGNIDSQTPAGSYNSTLTYTITGSF